ncbi:hypothetical protein PWG14_07980, partial (plasmid) [Chromobacterium amazonense]|uniref:hypothetical protein n=1 Tax=Chromobacterium amazonense TaxID=1382803 RepID=UPI00237D7B29
MQRLGEGFQQHDMVRRVVEVVPGAEGAALAHGGKRAHGLARGGGGQRGAGQSRRDIGAELDAGLVAGRGAASADVPVRLGGQDVLHIDFAHRA